MQQSRSKQARRNPRPRMIKVTVHEKRRIKEEQPTPTSSPSHNHDSVVPRQTPLICTGAEPIHQVHGPPKPRATESMLRNRIHISAIFPPFFMFELRETGDWDILRKFMFTSKSTSKSPLSCIYSHPCIGPYFSVFTYNYPPLFLCIHNPILICTYLPIPTRTTPCPYNYCSCF